MSGIGPSELDSRRTDADVFLLDIRPEKGYEQSHIEGSYNAPVYDALRAGESDALEPYLPDVPSDTEVVVVCKAGVVARTATERLEDAGYSATTLTGGYAGWRQYEGNTLLYRVLSGLRRLFD